jgi:hypothetical protein
LARRGCGQGSARSGVAGSAGGVLLGGGRRTYKSSFWEILVRGERASTKFRGGSGAPQSRGSEELTMSCLRAGE